MKGALKQYRKTMVTDTVMNNAGDTEYHHCFITVWFVIMTVL